MSKNFGGMILPLAKGMYWELNGHCKSSSSKSRWDKMSQIHYNQDGKRIYKLPCSSNPENMKISRHTIMYWINCQKDALKLRTCYLSSFSCTTERTTLGHNSGIVDMHNLLSIYYKESWSILCKI